MAVKPGKSMSSLEKGLAFFDLLTPDSWQSSESLGRHLGVKSRAVKKYASLLMAYGWPILGDKGKGRGYKLSESGVDNLRFTSRDLFSLAILLAHGSSTLPAYEANKLKSKLKSLLPDPARVHVSTLEELVTVQGFAPKEWDLVEMVGTCLYDRCCSLVVDYRKDPDSETERRHLLPKKIRAQGSTLYLDLFDLDKQQTRSFRFDRILRANLLRQDQPHAEPEVTEFETHKWDFGSGTPTEVRIEVTRGLGHWLRENPEHPSQCIASAGERDLVTYQVRRLELFADWLLGLRGARVVGPDSLRDLVRNRARAWLEDQGTLSVAWEK